MKPILYSLLAAATLGPAHAQTVLIGAGVQNGDFNEDTDPTDQRPFADTPIWENIAGPQTAQCTRTNLSSPDGTRNHVLTHTATVVAAQDTNYSIQSGDRFSISYEWRDAFNWDDAVDEVRITLFTTDDDTITGIPTVLTSIDSGLSTINSTYELVDQDDFYIAGAAEVGKFLFLSIDTVNTDGSGFGRFDNLELIVSPAVDVSLDILSGDYAFGDLFHLNGSSTTTSTVTFTNSGQASDLTIEAISLNEDAGGLFSISSAPSLPLVVTPGETFEVEITATGGSGYTDYAGELFVDAAGVDQDTTLPITANISSSGDLLYVNNNRQFNDGLAGWSTNSIATTGLTTPNGARVRGFGDDILAPTTIFANNLTQAFNITGSPQFIAKVRFAIPEFNSFAPFPAEASLFDRSFHLAIMGSTILPGGGVWDDADAARTIIDLFYMPAGAGADLGAGFFLFDGTDFIRVAGLGTLLESTGYNEDGTPPTNLNSYMLTIVGNDFGKPTASYEIFVSDANTDNTANSSGPLTTFHALDPTTNTAAAIALTTADIGTNTTDPTPDNTQQTSFWVDEVTVDLGVTLPVPLATLLEAPTRLKLDDNSIGTIKFTIGNLGTGADLVVSDIPAPIFTDSRYSLASPTLPVSIAPGGSQEFEVTVDLSASSGDQIIPTSTVTLNLNDPLFPEGVLELDSEIVSGGQRILIDYDDGIANGIHEASINNGGFEDGTAPLSFVDTPSWTARFSPEADINDLTLALDPATGSNHGLASGWQDTGTRDHPAQTFTTTDWILQEGDFLEVEAKVKGSTNYTGQAINLVVDVLNANGGTIFDAVNGLNGGERWASDAYLLSGDGSTYETINFTTAEIQPGSPWIGNRLRLRFFIAAPRDTFVHLDDVTVIAKLKQPVVVISDLQVTNIDFDPGSKEVKIRFIDTGATGYTVESDADFDYAGGTIDFPLDGSEDTVSFPGEIEFTFTDSTVTGTSHSWRVRED